MRWKIHLEKDCVQEICLSNATNLTIKESVWDLGRVLHREKPKIRDYTSWAEWRWEEEVQDNQILESLRIYLLG